jgi:hypothetical protein
LALLEREQFEKKKFQKELEKRGLFSFLNYISFLILEKIIEKIKKPLFFFF